MLKDLEITSEERDKILTNYIKEGKLDTFPSKVKRKIIILEYFIQQFEREKDYTEKEVNDKLKGIYEDFVTIRRALVDFGFMERSRDGKEYRVK
ncbi:DUF2087 domain-containing protein [Ornithinibacillus californiensis]|uniref:DUF2087 domain-containing protein n=1 Tax=Ornithinibacillus californiensis TaxID=161536 RepID=UPI00069F95AA|nr:DUF2087 domain-containing protein [Ornithinibacillus californiensis]